MVVGWGFIMVGKGSLMTKVINPFLRFQVVPSQLNRILDKACFNQFCLKITFLNNLVVKIFGLALSQLAT